MEDVQALKFAHMGGKTFKIHFATGELKKGAGLSGYTQAQINAVARRLNELSGKTLNDQTPTQQFHESLASIG